MIERRTGECPNIEARAQANETVNRRERYKQIKRILRGRNMTAKEIAVEMHANGYTPTDERNFSAPRLTEMLKIGDVEIVGKERCRYTGKTVSVYALREVG